MGEKELLSEEDVKNIYITPSIDNKNWDIKTQIRMEVPFTDGKVIVRGNITARGTAKKADYILYTKANNPIAVVEAKKNTLQVGTGMQQAIEYAQILDIPFAYSSNGEGFLEHDMLTGKEKELQMDEFPTPEELWNRYKQAKEITADEEKIITEPYYYKEGEKHPRYYQRIAINRTTEAIAKGRKRLLLVMATGTGKTYTAFQIIYRLWKSKQKKKILYLADRNILIDQTMSQDFQPFGNSMTKIENKKMDSSYEIYMALYQQLTDGCGMDIFKQFKEDFFDLIIVDECHRGSAAEDSNWRKILEYFKSATQIGMTATPKETKEVSNINYFGEPIYTYSLKQGIDDGFLAPYKVIRVTFDKDILGYKPKAGQLDVNGNEIEDKIYYGNDFDRKIIIDDRTKKVAEKITELLKNTDRYSKTIVFCIDIEHAERMRQALVNENSDMVKEDPRYIMRITGDNPEGKAQLDNFIDVEEKYPTIVTTSKLMTTGVDCKTCKVIVIDSNISSMTEFKQIIGRGTRIREDYGKNYFTILDFRNACRLFQDKDFDGDPETIMDINGDEPITPEKEKTIDENFEITDKGVRTPDDKIEVNEKIRVRGIDVEIFNEMVQYYDKDGRIVTESIRDFSKKSILNEYADLKSFINRWNNEEKKQVIIEELKEQGVLLDILRKEAGYKHISDFDLILHIAYDKKPLTKQERANNVMKRGYLYKYSDIAQKVLAMLLEKYQDDKLIDLTDPKILELRPFDEYGSPMKIVKEFGGKEKYIEAVDELENELYVG